MPKPSSTSFMTVCCWTLQLISAAAFIAAAAAKVAGAPPMVAIFEQIGIGQWFRYATAAVELTGALLLLWPGKAAYGAAVLCATMGAALLTHFLLIGGNWRPAAALLVLNLLVLWLRRAQLNGGAGEIARRPAF